MGPLQHSESAAVIVTATAPARRRASSPATVWDRVKRTRAAVFGLVVVAAVIGGALLAPWIAPYDPARQFTDGLSPEGRPQEGVSGCAHTSLEGAMQWMHGRY